MMMYSVHFMLIMYANACVCACVFVCDVHQYFNNTIIIIIISDAHACLSSGSLGFKIPITDTDELLNIG